MSQSNIPEEWLPGGHYYQADCDGRTYRVVGRHYSEVFCFSRSKDSRGGWRQVYSGDLPHAIKAAFDSFNPAQTPSFNQRGTFRWMPGYDYYAATGRRRTERHMNPFLE